jgi:hypothetical protein
MAITQLFVAESNRLLIGPQIDAWKHKALELRKLPKMKEPFQPKRKSGGCGCNGKS